MPTDSPKNITTRFQTPDVIEISYDPPPEEARNGQVIYLCMTNKYLKYIRNNRNLNKISRFAQNTKGR